MSVAPCFADTNDLALDPATTAEDTQHTLQSILSHTGSVLCSLPVSPSALLPHSFYLSCLSFALPSPLSSKFLVSSLSLTKDAISLCLFYPKHFLCLLSLYLYLSAIPFLAQLFTLSISISFPLSPSFSLSPPPIFPLLLLTLSLPGQQLHCPWVGVNNVSPHGAPVQSQPRRQGAPENTHNSMFQLGCGIKGSLTHG